MARIELVTPFTVIANATFDVIAQLFDYDNTQVYGSTEWAISDTTRLARVGGCALATPCDWSFIELETRGAGSVTLFVTAGEQSITQPLSILPAVRFGSVSVGLDIDCAVVTDGTVYCLGPPGAGRALGRSIVGSEYVDHLPLPIESTARFVSVSVGSSHACGVTAQGEVHCWGRNDWGQTGRGQPVDSTYVTPDWWVVPGAINGNLRFQMVSAGGLVTCGVTDDGRAFCWGDNRNEALGVSTRQVKIVDPLEVAGGVQWATVDVSGSTVCGLTVRGAAYCWGANDHGQAGNGSYDSVRSPAPVDGNLVFSALSVGHSHVCGLADNQAVYCWGSNGKGQLGVTPTGDSPRPVKVESNLAWTDVGASSETTCALSVDGTLYCWGRQCWGTSSSFGDTCFRSAQPTPRFDQVAFRSLEGAWKGCGIGTDSLAYCWPGQGYRSEPPVLQLVPGQRAPQ